MKRNLILAALALLATLANAQDIAGDWQGTIKTGMGELRLVLHVAKNADGTLKALVDSPDQNAPRVPIDSMTLEANKVTFLFSRPEGIIRGHAQKRRLNQGKLDARAETPARFEENHLGCRVSLISAVTASAGGIYL
jgi:hypothetical protein